MQKDVVIYKQAAIDAVEKHACNTQRILDAISALPSAQPEIIRCKDCKWWSNDDYRECSSPNYDDGYVTSAGFYCGYAERRTDG